MNSIRALYQDHPELFRPLVSPADPYADAARAVAVGDADAAAEVVGRLAAAQEARLLGALS